MGCSCIKQIRNKLKDLMTEALELDIADELKNAFRAWLEGKDNAEASEGATQKMLPLLEAVKGNDVIDEIIDKKDFLIKKSQWIIGGDGWAYDIGFGGLDDVIASGDDVNILVLDTEVYQNTGGQASKASPTAAVAKFASAGKRTKKKDLGMIAMTYGYVYVTQVSMGADQNQLIRALKEAEAYNGPSLIIAYSPCIAHGIRAGMGKTQEQGKKAVESGYWHLYRYNPSLKEEGKNPFILDSKESYGIIQRFLVRRSALFFTH